MHDCKCELMVYENDKEKNYLFFCAADICCAIGMWWFQTRIFCCGFYGGGLFDVGTGQVITAESITHRLMPPYEWWFTAPSFFGGHLVHDASTIAIVQDEITALLGAVAEPSFTWLAVGYGQNVTGDMLVQLAGHDVVMFADSLNAEAWHGLRLPNKRMAVSDAFVCADVNQYLLNKRRR